MSKVELFRSLLFTALAFLLLWDVILWMINPGHRLPTGHKQWLLTGTLLWLTLVLSSKNSDDDWAGQF
ncbi:hypothetical protein [Mucilaginibacter aquariorum]|uniref:Uncharacterized protein n=1 Tax=Mucilaginibacter aquariorum TaxID=2967225 RepID=A0ABT1SXJ3_9SPHI|nr:hypothetical protein [Mucilaginibacter aquariorum]MCQ6957071.1 hypothetical protein [Mucilaginibacter aquariorum]